LSPSFKFSIFIIIYPVNKDGYIIFGPLIINQFAFQLTVMFGRINSFVKDIVLASRIAYLIYPFRKFLLFLFNLAELTAWIQRNKRSAQQNDFYVVKRNYAKRLNGFEFIINNYHLEQAPVTYLEFGVASGVSFEWWLNHLKNPESVFLGFDTFEGLPEDWGLFFKKAPWHMI